MPARIRRRAAWTVVAASTLIVSACSSGAAAPSSSPPPSTSASTSIPAQLPPSTSASSSSPTPRPTHTHVSHSTAPPSSSSAPPSTSSAPSSASSVDPPSEPPVSGSPLVVLDPGHNGGNAAHPAEINRQVPAGFGMYKACNTTGTETNAGYPEHAFNWDVALRTESILQAHGVRVLLTRHSDTGVGPCVNERAAIESTHGVSAAIAIHADGAGADDHGFVVFRAARQPAGATAETMRLSNVLSVAMHTALASRSGISPANYDAPGGYATTTEYAGLNLSTVPTSFIELGNMRNAHDSALQSSASGRQAIAAALAYGLLSYLRS